MLVLAVLISVLGPPTPTARAMPQGGVVGAGTPGSCTEAALDAVLAGGGLVTFHCGPNPHTIAVTSTKSIVTSLTLDGAGLITLSSPVRIFSVPEPGSLTLRNLTLRDGSVQSWAVSVGPRGVLVVQGVTFKNSPRGSIFNGGGRVTVRNSTFQGMPASSGPFIDSEGGGTLLVENSSFTNNQNTGSSWGAAIYNGSLARATIIGSHFQGNSIPGGPGGAIYNTYAMTVTKTTIVGNGSRSGGGIYNSGRLILEDSIVMGNTAQAGFGGGLATYNNTTTDDLQVEVRRTTFSGNTSIQTNARGGAIFFQGASATGAISLTNVTVSGNHSDVAGGGLYLSIGTVTIDSSTFYSNTATGTSGDNLQKDVGTISVRNSLLVNGGCLGDVADGGSNLQFPGSSCGATITVTNPLLGPLADNGGWAPTHALPANSPAVNAAVASCPSTDQRGVARPQAGGCDVGAYERGAVPGVTDISPDSAIVNGPGLTLTVYGASFLAGPNGSRVLWDGSPLTTTFGSNSVLTADVPANLLTVGKQVTIQVETRSSDGGMANSPKPFTIGYRTFLPLAIR